MIDNDKLRHKLNAPTAPEDLLSNIQSNWDAQLNKRKRSSGNKNAIRAIAASFLMGVLIFSQLNTTPGIVVAAFEDILVDASKEIGIEVPLDNLLAYHLSPSQINPSQLKMTKLCTLKKQRMLHMVINGINQGEVHFFVNQGEMSMYDWQAQRGQKNNFSWEIILPSENVSVLVMYTKNMNKDVVKKLIDQMFYV